jgi:penicillin-binding protein 1A
MVSAYAPFANGGQAIAPHVVQRVRTKAGKVLYTRARQNLGQIIDPRHVGMMNAMMRETLLIGTAQKAQLPGWPAAGKTGTSQEFRDAWFIGYTGHLVAGQRRFLADQTPHRRRASGRSVDALHARRAPERAGRRLAGADGTDANRTAAAARKRAGPARD